jgi:hypothetical protein
MQVIQNASTLKLGAQPALVQRCPAENVRVGIFWRHPPLKHHTTPARHGEQSKWGALHMRSICSLLSALM